MEAKQLTMVPEPPQNMVAMLERLASNPDVPVDKLERLLAMQERISARQAETDFNAAMSTAQSEIGRISTDLKNTQTGSKYASYAKLDKILRPIYTKHGFALSFDTGEPPSPEYIRVICRVSHRGGHSHPYHIDMPADGKGAKGGDVMTKTHASGAAASYGMRYLLKMIFNVAIGEEDTDGNGPPSQKITQEQALDIQSLIEEVKADKARFLAWVQVERIEDIPAKLYQTCVRELQRKRAAK
jgi:hypothetical protein